MSTASRFTKCIGLLLLLIGTLLLDFLAFSFLSACPACASFGQFITTPSALSSPILLSLGTYLTFFKRFTKN